MQRGVAPLLVLIGLLPVAIPTVGRAAPAAPAGPAAVEAPLTNEEIVKLTKAGLSPDLIVMKIKQAPEENLDVSTDALIALRQQGVGDAVITAVFERVAKRTAPPPTRAPSLVPAATSSAPAPRPATETPAAQAKQEPGPFPDLELVRAEGGSVRLSELRGSVILMVVWATWNPPSGKELPFIQKLDDLYRGRGLVVVLLDVDTDRTRAAPFLKKLGVSLPVYFPSSAEAGSLTAGGIPATILLGPDRTVLDRTVGFYSEWEARWKQAIERHARP